MRIATRLMIFLLAAGIHAESPASVWDGVYSPEQANNGKTLYGEQCASCHQDSLSGKLGTAPPLTGDQFKANWNDLTADDLFEYIVKSMPRGSTTRLSREQTSTIVAFLLTSNGFPAGAKALPNEAAALQAIRFEASKPK